MTSGSAATPSGRQRLATWIREEGGLLAEAVPADLGPLSPSEIAVRASAGIDEVELAVETILEGYRLHYAQGVVVRDADPDLALLAGDRLYAHGLAVLATLGDLDAIAALADVISACAAAHAADDPDAAAAAWAEGAKTMGAPRP